jgi:hypothetical protein
MALVLGMYLDKDNEIWLNDLKVTIDSIESVTRTKITVHDKFMPKKMEIDTNDWRQVTNNVRMMLGNDTNRDQFCRVLVEAPKNIKVDRGAKRRSEQA